MRVRVWVAALGLLLAACAPEGYDIDAMEDGYRAEGTGDRTGLAFETLYDCRAAGGCPESCFGAERGAVGAVHMTWKRADAPALGRTVGLRAYVHFPPGFDPRTGRAPVIAMFHGGGLAAGAPTFWLPVAHYLASRGMVAVTFQYRLSGTHGSSAEQSVADARSALRWLRIHAADLGIDPGRLAVAGDSAGGFLALASALAAPLPDGDATEAGVDAAPDMIFAFYPVVDATLHGWPLHLSPLHQLAGGRLPFTVVSHGDADGHPATPFAVSRDFCAAAPACWFAREPGLDHAFLGSPVAYDRALTMMDQVLIQAGYLGGARDAVPTWVAGAAPHCRMNALQGTWQSQFGYGPGGGAW